jgi:hypothetical protein
MKMKGVVQVPIVRCQQHPPCQQLAELPGRRAPPAGQRQQPGERTKRAPF